MRVDVTGDKSRHTVVTIANDLVGDEKVANYVVKVNDKPVKYIRRWSRDKPLCQLVAHALESVRFFDDF